MSKRDKAALAKGADDIRKAEASEVKVHQCTKTSDKLHPAVEWLPELSDAEYEELRDDIKARGLCEPILIKSGQIIDGRHRLKACRELGIEPTFHEYAGTDILAEILSRNLLRRHLTTRQRADIAAKLTNLNDGSNRHEKKVAPSNDGATAGKSEGVPVTVEQAAEMLDVSESSVERARKRAGKTKPKAKKKQAQAGTDKPKRRRNDVPPYEPKPTEQAALDSLERALKKINEKISPQDMKHLLYKLDRQEKQRWIAMFEPLVELNKMMVHLS